MHVAEVEALKELTCTIAPFPTIINIGAGEEGISTLAMLEERPGAVVFSIDTEIRPGEAVSLETAGIDPARAIRLLGRSQDIGQLWTFPAHMLFVDGGHSFTDVEEDIKLFVPWITQLIVFHDYVPCPTHKRLRRATFAIDEGMVGYEQIAHVDRLIAFKGGQNDAI